VSLGTGVAPQRAARRGGGVVPSFHSTIDFVQGVLNLLTDTDAAHDLVQTYLDAARRNRQSPTRYHRLDVVVDSAHLDLAEGDSLKLTDLRHLALDYVQREKPFHWRSFLRELGHRQPLAADDAYYDADLRVGGHDEARLVRRPVDSRHKPLHDVVLHETPSSWLRPLRKRAAKLTGIHGFFSGKKYPSPSSASL